jgi:drug/metabolite transporter (DMT)-like permease
VENRQKTELKSIAIYGLSAWGTALYIAFSRFATLESGLPPLLVACFRFILGMPLVFLFGWWATGRHDFYKSRNIEVQLKRSLSLFFVTVFLIAGAKALKNIALTNAYTFMVFAIVALRTYFVHRKPLHRLGWVSVVLCIVGVSFLVVASGSAGEHPILGLALVSGAMYCHALMMDQAAVLAKSGDSALCSLFWCGVVGFGVAVVYAVYIAVEGASQPAAIAHVPQVDAQGVAMMIGVTIMAIAPQGGYAYAGTGASPLTLAPAGLTQIIPAAAIQMYLDGGRVPSDLTIAGIAALLASALCSIKGQKRLAATAT